MIGFDDVDELDDEQRYQVQALFERIDTIRDLPEDLGTIEELDELIEDCERIGFPHLVASALFTKYSIFAGAGMVPEVLDTYATLMQVVRRHGHLIAEDHVSLMLNSVATATMTLVDEPSIALERITRVVDLVEEQIRLRGADVVGVYVARAVVAAAAGDEAATLEWIERWRAGNSDDWRPGSPGVIQMEIPLIARFDVRRAIETLEQRLRMLGVDVRHLDAAHPEVRSVAGLLAMLACSYVREGRRGEADVIADHLVTAVGIAELARIVVVDDIVPVLEPRPAEALVVVDHALGNLHFDESEWRATAAVARSRILADAHGEEGRLLRALADQAALAHDRRGRTDVHRRELEDFWWAGLPDGPRPDTVDDETVWGDLEARAERILAAGWLPRAGAVGAGDPPVAIKYRYVELMGDCMGILAAESAGDADALAEALTARAERLRCATSRYSIPLVHGLRAGQHGDVATLVTSYQRAQGELLRGSAGVADPIMAMGEKIFPTIVEQMVASPAVPWPLIHEVLAAEARLRELTGGPESHVMLARAEIAAHRDDREALRDAIRMLEDSLAREGSAVDRVAIDLEVVRLSAIPAPELSEATAGWIATVGDAEQTRAATAWSCWFGTSVGNPQASIELAEMLAAADGDVTSFGPLPGWVLLEGLTMSGADLRPVIDAVLEEADAGSAADLCVFGAAGSALLALAPEDPRGPELRDEVRRITHGLDLRNGDARWSTWVCDRWFPGDPAFGVPA